MKEGALAIVKFFCFLLLLPLVVATALAFQTQIFALPVHKEEWVIWGGLSFVLVYLFLYNFKEVYVFGQGVVGNLLKFFEPVAAVGSKVIPIYTILTICVYLVISLIGLGGKYEQLFLLLLAFTAVMHIVVTAHELYEGDKHPLKADYFFAFSLVFVVTVFVLSLLFGLMISEFSFINFFKSLSHQTIGYYSTIYHKLFVNP